ncbi:hypothetical protein [Streptomyces himastatinicus]|uniref:hypothetical protein n=1 Tax=Streptomyces himastatinicus TaxID=998084 RepID=UPI0001B4BA0B|nr:hypothetical protein [Streptomyces himastatinicus]
MQLHTTQILTGYRRSLAIGVPYQDRPGGAVKGGLDKESSSRSTTRAGSRPTPRPWARAAPTRQARGPRDINKPVTVQAPPANGTFDLADLTQGLED